MKPLKFVALLLAITSLFSCKKDDNLPSGDMYIDGVTRIVSIKGTDTVSTPFMTARIDATQGLILASDEDTKLKAELIGYQNLGGGAGLYKLKVINLSDCQSIIRWNWQGLTIDSISPPSDVVHAHDTVTFTLWGDTKPGKITLNSQADNPTSCGNSKTLIINITTAILPSRFTSWSTKRVGDKMIVNFSNEFPQDVDFFLVMWSPTGNPAEEVLKYRILSNPDIKQYTISFPAVKKGKAQ